MVVTPVSSTKTSRSGAIPLTVCRKERRSSWTSGRSRWLAYRLFFLRVRPWRSRANHSVFRLQVKPPLLQLLERGVGLLADQLGEAFAIARAEGWWRSASMRFGVESPGGSPPLEQAGDRGGADAEDPCDLTDRAFVLIDGRGDAFAKIQRIGAHDSDLPSYRDPHPRMLFRWNYSCVQPGGKPL